MSICYVSIGSNLDDRIRIMRSAVRLIAETLGICFDPSNDTASLYETSPVGVTGQGDYLNSALRLRTSIAPRGVIELLQSIESSLGRIRTEHWGSRTIDLDLLFYDNSILNEPELAIPHPRMHERLFVLEPLAELTPDHVHPMIQKSVLELLEDARQTRPEDRIQRIACPEWVLLDLTARNR